MTKTFFTFYIVEVQVIEMLFNVNAVLFNEMASSPFNHSLLLNA